MGKGAHFFWGKARHQHKYWLCHQPHSTGATKSWVRLAQAVVLFISGQRQIPILHSWEGGENSETSNYHWWDQDKENALVVRQVQTTIQATNTHTHTRISLRPLLYTYLPSKSSSSSCLTVTHKTYPAVEENGLSYTWVTTSTNVVCFHWWCD